MVCLRPMIDFFGTILDLWPGMLQVGLKWFALEHLLQSKPLGTHPSEKIPKSKIPKYKKSKNQLVLYFHIIQDRSSKNNKQKSKIKKSKIANSKSSHDPKIKNSKKSKFKSSSFLNQLLKELQFPDSTRLGAKQGIPRGSKMVQGWRV